MDLRQLGTFGYVNEGLLSGSVWTTGIYVSYFPWYVGAVEVSAEDYLFLFWTSCYRCQGFIKFLYGIVASVWHVEGTY